MVRVLLVEDETQLRRILARNLEQRGYAVAEAGTAEEALTACSATMPDVLVLDINLPDVSGWDVLRGLHARGLPPRAVIAASAAPPSRGRLEEFGPVCFLPKPFPIQALLRAVERATAKDTSHEPMDSAAV